MSMIELMGISKIYKNGAIKTEALNEVNLSVDKGEYIAIMGTSGSGKTTLLNILGCMDAPTTGKYLLDGEDITNKGEPFLCGIRGKKIAFVFQHFALIDTYTVYENVEIPLLKKGYSRKERHRIAKNALEQVGMADLSSKIVTGISGGQKQRVAIARALASGAEVLLADEPTGALDSKTSREIINLFSELNHQGKTVILITHDEKVASNAKRIIQIEDGGIVSDEM
ncbi:MAG: ABC transporter ATP-binding protein [Anaerovoracaceae bacterium]